MAGTSSVGGLVSGLDTATIIDQLIAVSRKRIDAVVTNQTKYSDKLTSYQSLNTNLLNFKAKAKTLRDIDTFNVFKNSITTDSTNFTASDLLSVSTTEDASPGSHTIRFTSSSQLAQARQLSSKSYSSTTTALNISGEFIINGRAISITTSDALSDIAIKINNVNSGANATGVTASILSVSSTDKRLILTSDDTGKDKFSISDASAGGTDILQTLGLVASGTSIKNTTSDGAQSDGFSNSETVVGSMLGLANAQSGTVTIGGESVAINLSSESLTTIAGNINTALTAASKGTASVVSTTIDGVRKYYIDISGTTSFSDDNHILETLGILEAQQSSVSEVHTASTANTRTTAGGGGSIISTTKFGEINTGSDTNNVTNGDTITITGTDHNGASVSGTFTITNIGSDDIQDLLTAIETVLEQNGGGNSFTASVVGGQIVVTDNQAGDSQMSVKIITNNEGGGTLDFGVLTATTQGYNMQTKTGQDAKVEINGVAVTRSSNSFDDIINGVTIDLKRVESGSTVNLVISRDIDSIKSSINDFITEYNNIIEFINQQFTFNEETKRSGVLAGESVLYTIKSTIQSTISSINPLLSSNYNVLSLIGITSDNNGKLSLKDSKFQSAINTDFNAVRRLLIQQGTTTNGEVTYIGHTKKTVAGEYAVVINTVSTQATVTGADLGSDGIGPGNTETLTITDTLTGRVATINLDGDAGENGSSIDNIVNAINSELSTDYIQTIVGDNAQTAGGPPITGSTTFGAIDGETLNQNNEVISISGKTRSGGSVNNTFIISNKDTTTIQDFLSFIEDSYNNEVSATINSNGEIVLIDNTVGDSQLSITITEPAGKGVDFGNVLETNNGGSTGRYAMEITASKSGNQLVLTHNSYGSNYGFTTNELNDLLGTEGTYSGVNVAGTINGEDATGSGQVLTGNAPSAGETTSVEGLSIKITSTTTGSKGDVKLTIGVAGEIYRELDFFTDQFDGLVTIRMNGLQDSIDNLQDTIDDMEERLVMEQTRLENQFVQLELNLSKLQSISSFLSQQLGSLPKP